MVARIGVPSIMATLAANFFWYGISILLAGGLQVTLKGSQDNFVHELLVGRLFGIVPLQAFWSLALAVLLWFILNRHKFGEGIMFIGDNANVARVMGVNVEATRIKLFTLHGAIAAFSGIIVTLDIGVFYPDQGNFLLPAMASVFIGGTSIAGGSGSIFGTVFGAYIIGSLAAGVVALRMRSNSSSAFLPNPRSNSVSAIHARPTHAVLVFSRPLPSPSKMSFALARTASRSFRSVALAPL